jgi:hypothetical protein
VSEQKPGQAEFDRINAETAKIGWSELQRFFAQGKAVLVTPDLDLVAVACELSCDNTEQVDAWMVSGKIAVVNDTQALEWLEANALMWAVVVRPWVLVQPVKPKA